MQEPDAYMFSVGFANSTTLDTTLGSPTGNCMLVVSIVQARPELSLSQTSVKLDIWVIVIDLLPTLATVRCHLQLILPGTYHPSFQVFGGSFRL